MNLDVFSSDINFTIDFWSLDSVEYNLIQHIESTVLPVYYTKYNVLLAPTL